MKKAALSAALLGLFTVQLHAAEEQSTAAAAATPPATQTMQAAPAPQQATESKEKAAQTIDCQYQISAEQKTIDPKLVVTWAKQAAKQSFDLDHGKIDTQLSALENCYTKQGWQSFKEALNKSGNLKAIQTENLDVNCKINGEAKMLSSKENHWEISMPMDVVYKNDKDQLTQKLMVTVLVGRKTTGDLGIMQIIAMPEQNTPAATQENTTESAEQTKK